MKITRASASLSGTAPDSCTVELECDDGSVGRAIGSATLLRTAPQLAEEILTGADPRAVAGNWQALSAANESARGVLGEAAAVLDCALWDLKAQIAGVPLWRALGALTPRVNVHARVRGIDTDVNATCRALAARGIRGAVLESTLDAGSDIARLTAARAALGAEAALMLDLGEQLHATDALGLITRIERDIDLTWVEAPAAHGDVSGAKRVSDGITGAVCLGARLESVAAYLPHLAARSVDIVQIDTARIGISGALQIADAAFGLELPVTLTRSPGNLHVMLAAALAYCASVEADDTSLPAAPIKVERGWGVCA